MSSLPHANQIFNPHPDLIHGAAYQVGDQNLPLQLFWNSEKLYWVLCRLDTQSERWRPVYVLLGAQLLVVVKDEGLSWLGTTNYTVADLRLVDDGFDYELWADCLAYADAHLPGGGAC